jgi:alpha,alpha-trehalase
MMLADETTMAMPEPSLNRQLFDAVLFDLDGVLTDTASIHAVCWKKLFDDFLSRHAEASGEPFQPFDVKSDYAAHVDGKPRYDGVRDFLGSRGITLAEGSSADPPGDNTVQALGNHKDAFFDDALESQGVEVFQSSVDLVKQLRHDGMKTAVVSASRHCAEVLDAAGIADLFDTRVDGNTIEALGIVGKPAPDSFLEAARELGAEPSRAVVVEDAISGVQSGRAGGFGLVVGVARKDNARELMANGADMTVADLEELMP